MSEEENLDLSDWEDVLEAEPEKEVPVESNKSNQDKQSDDENWDDIIAIEVLENYCGTLMNEMETFRKQGILCDAIIAVDDVELPVHKNVISAISPFFKNIFSKLHDPDDNKITLRNLSGNTMDDILHFCYTGEICIHDGNVRQLLAASNFLQLKNLKEMVDSYLEKKLSPASAVDILLLADKHKCEKLLLVAEKLVENNFIIVSKTEGFKKLSFELLYQFIQSDNIRVSKEEEVYEAVMQWLNVPNCKEKESKLNYLSNLLREIRFPLMTPSYITEISLESVILENRELYDIVTEGIEYHNPISSNKLHYDPRLIKPRKFMGKVWGIVCAGGWYQDKPVNDVFAFIDSSQDWFPLKSLPDARYSHSVVACNGSVYVLGGRDKNTKLMSSVIKFDPSLNKWQDVKSLPLKVASAGVCVYDSQIYVVGGFSFNGSIDSVFKYSSRYNVWQKVGNLKYSRGGCTVVTGDGYMYVIGGMRKSAQSSKAQWEYLDTMEIFQRERNEWSLGKTLLSKRAFGVSVYINQKIYLTGGQSQLMILNKTLEIYNTVNQVWTTLPYSGIPRSMSGVAVYHNQFYVIGGTTKEGEVVNTVETFDIGKGRSVKTTPLPKEMCSLQCCALQIQLAVLQGISDPTLN